MNNNNKIQKITKIIINNNNNNNLKGFYLPANQFYQCFRIKKSINMKKKLPELKKAILYFNCFNFTKSTPKIPEQKRKFLSVCHLIQITYILVSVALILSVLHLKKIILLKMCILYCLFLLTSVLF